MSAALDNPHILVVDDDERLRALLQRYLSQNGFRVTAAPGAEEARSLMKSMAFDLLIVDVMMPGESGLDFTRSVRAQASQIPMLMLTARGEPEDRIAGLELGADDYLPKPFEPRELVLRCAGLLRRAAPPAQPHREIKMGDTVFDADRGELRRKGKPVRLTSSESALLKLFAANVGRPFSRTDLCTRLGVSLERSIDVQVTRLRRKIEEDPKLPLYIQTVRGIGYMLVPDRVA
jgi:two-component system phosphate regulon response regulator OmpR